MADELYTSIHVLGDVLHAVQEMGSKSSQYRVFYFSSNEDSLEEAARLVGNLGDLAVRNHLARALATCTIPDAYVCFDFCHLSLASVQLLANALQSNTSLIEFACMDNGCESDEAMRIMRHAVVHTEAPLARWNYEDLSSDILRERSARQLPAPALATVPNTEQVVAARRGKVLAEQQLGQKRAKLAESLTAKQRLDSMLDEVLAKANALKAKRAELDEQLAQDEAQVEAVKEDLAKHARVIEVADEVKRRLGLVESSNSKRGEDAPLSTLCQICLKNKKTHCLYKCGHQACGQCVEKIIYTPTTKPTCPFCLAAVADAIQLFEFI